MQNPSSDLSIKTYRDYPRWPAVLSYVEYARSLGAQLLLLFGSVARGEYRSNSDADVLVLTDLPLVWKQAYQHTGGVVQPVIKTVDEFIAQLHNGEPFFIEMMEEGVVLYDSDGWYARLTNEAIAAKQRWGLQRTEYGWQWAR